MADKNLLLKEIALNGKLRTNVDNASVGPNDFVTLKNLRYTDTNPKGVGGMTKINTAALANPKIKNGIQYRKAFPASESHVLVQAKDANDANPKVYRNSTAIPSQGAFTATALFTDSAGSGTGRFSNAPNDKVVYCNGKDTAIWGGSEMVISGYIDFDPAGTYQYDYTDQVSNDLSTTGNTATIHTIAAATSIDANTMLQLHLDNSVTDTSLTTPHTVTNTNVTFATSAKKFGTHGAVFNGTNATLTIPDDADFDFSGGAWTVDFWMKSVGSAVNQPIYYHGTNASNYTRIYIAKSAEHITLNLEIKATTTVVSLASSDIPATSTTYAHYEIVGDGTSYYMFRNGLSIGTLTDADKPANYTGTVYIGNDGSTNWLEAKIDEFRVSKVARHTSPFTPATAAYEDATGGTSASIYIGSQLPLQGVKWYVLTPNASASTAAVNYWDGDSFESAGTVTDGTAAAGVCLAQTGSMTFGSTVATAKRKIIDGKMLFWYQVVISGTVDAATTIYMVTLDAPVQALPELWDGSFSPIASFLKHTSGAATTYDDYTVNVFEDFYDVNYASTFMELDSLPTATGYILAGFAQRQTGVRLNLVGGAINTTANTTATAYYYNGSAAPSATAAWSPVASSDDGTSGGAISLSKSGTIVWVSPASGSELPVSIAASKGEDTPKLYYYKIVFSQNLSANVQLYFAGGIPLPLDVVGYTFPFNHVNRLFLFGSADEPNRWVCSAANAPQVLTGIDTTGDYLGDNTKPTAAASLYSRYGSTTENVAVICKQSETWVLLGTDPTTFKQYPADKTIGCVAPLTMTAIPSYSINDILQKPVAIWQSSRGIEIFDGVTIANISHDIADKFDPLHANYVGAPTLATCTGFFDSVYNEYHWIVPGSQEWVYDLSRKKWFQIVRGTAKYLQFGISVFDMSGQAYSYGAVPAGYLERLENGTDFDGVAIAHQFRLGDLAPYNGSVMYRTELRGIRLIGVSKNTTTQTIAVTHYGDGNSAGTTITAMSCANATSRLFNVYRSIGNPVLSYIFHSTDYSISTNNETFGFEPMFVVYAYKLLDMDTR